MLKKSDLFKSLLKFIFASAIIFWLIKSKRLDFSLFALSLKSGIFLLGISIIITQALLCFIRWKWLLEISSPKKFFLKDIIKIGWIGLFFNSVLPGAVTGDFIKLFYTKKLYSNFNNTYLVITTLLDRILGMAGLVTITAIFSLIYYSEDIKYLIHFNIILFIIIIFLLIPLFSSRKIKAFIVKINKRLPFLGDPINHILFQVWKIGKDVRTLMFAYTMSIFSQFLNVVAFWILTQNFYNHELHFGKIFTFVPFGLITVAIPIAPAGLGVGHLVFDTLFNYVGIQGGASLFNLYFLATAFVNIFGAVPYLFLKIGFKN